MYKEISAGRLLGPRALPNKSNLQVHVLLRNIISSKLATFFYRVSSIFGGCQGKMRQVLAGKELSNFILQVRDYI